MTVGDLLTSVRDTLSDTSKTRWTDATLIRHLNEGIKDISLRTKTPLTTCFIEVELNTHTYNLSNLFVQIERVELMSNYLPFVSHREMDAFDINWKFTTGEPTKVVYDKQNPATIRLYPIPSSGTSDNISYNQIYGGIIDIDYTCDVFNIPEIGELDDVPYFIAITGIPKIANYTSIDDSLDIYYFYEDALVHYILYKALRADMDTQNRTAANEEYALYAEKIKGTIENVVVSSATSAELASPYKGFV